jgi:uncharacterized protein YegL
MSVWSEFVQRAPRTIPVILLCDISGDMGARGKIEALNQSVRELLAHLKDEESPHLEIQVAVITFGGITQLHTPLQPAARINWIDMEASSGGATLGQALTLAAELIEDTNQIPTRSYRPAVVLLTDSHPTDDWQTGLRRLQQGRGSKAERFALAIGADADELMLQTFMADPEKKVFHAEEVREMCSLIRCIKISFPVRREKSNPESF